VARADDERDARRRAYEASTPRVTIRHFSGLTGGEWVGIDRLGTLRFQEAHTETYSLLGERGTRTREAPDRIHFDSMILSPAGAADRVRRMRAADSAKIDRIDERIRALQRERRALIEAAHERGIVLTEGQVVKAAKHNVAVAKGGYRGHGPRPSLPAPAASGEVGVK
jgi:hypothetical protein